MELPELTDGSVLLRPLQQVHAAAHLAGEDEAMARWLNGGRSTAASVARYIQDSLRQWRTGGSRRAFGVFHVGTGALVGSAEAHLDLPILASWQANLSFGVFPPWRGCGIADRSIMLLCTYLRSQTEIREAVLRISPDNHPSLRVAKRCSFRPIGSTDEAEGPMLRFVLSC